MVQIEWQQIFGLDDKNLKVSPIELDPQLIQKLWQIANQSLAIQPQFELFGRPAKMHRNIGFFSDISKGYQYTNQVSKSSPLTNEMKQLLQIVNQATGIDFNGLLFNLYIDGNDYIGAHRDAEENLSAHGVVALSLGAGRKFRIRDYRTKKIILDYRTHDSQLMWMSGPNFHKDWTHEVPKEKKIKEPRLSITFRQHN